MLMVCESMSQLAMHRLATKIIKDKIIITGLPLYKSLLISSFYCLYESCMTLHKSSYKQLKLVDLAKKGEISEQYTRLV